MPNELFGHFIAGVLAGIGVTALMAAFAARAYGKLLQFHACREWREAIELGGRRYFLMPEEEYKHLDSIRDKVLALVPPRTVPRGVGIPGRPDHDTTTRGDPLVPGR